VKTRPILRASLVPLPAAFVGALGVTLVVAIFGDGACLLRRDPQPARRLPRRRGDSSRGRGRPAAGGETLHNGIVLPRDWPPAAGRPAPRAGGAPVPEGPPKVIPIDTGRQLFVDDFLIERTTLKRTFHQASYYGRPSTKDGPARGPSSSGPTGPGR